MPKNNAALVYDFIKSHCANCGNPGPEREFNARLIGPVRLCKACHITECAVEVDLTLGGAERLTNDVQTKARTAARAFALACDGDFHKASLAEVIKTARSYAGAAQRISHPWNLRNAMAAARTAITQAETTRTPMDQARATAKKEAARVLVTAALHHLKHGPATDPQTAAHTLPGPNTSATPAAPANDPHTDTAGESPARRGDKPKKPGKTKRQAAPQLRNWRSKGAQPVTAGEAEAEALKVMAAADPKASSMLAAMFHNADTSRSIQMVWPSHWIGPATGEGGGYVGHECLLTSSMATGTNTTVPSDAYPGSLPLLSVLPTAHHRQNQACVDYAVELALREGAGQSEAGDFARYFIRQSHEIVNLEYEWAWEQWQTEKQRASAPADAAAPAAPAKPARPATARVTFRRETDEKWTATCQGERFYVVREQGYLGRWAVVAPDNTRPGEFRDSSDARVDNSLPPKDAVKKAIHLYRAGTGRDLGLVLTQTDNWAWDVRINGEERYAIRHDNRGPRQVGITWSIQHITYRVDGNHDIQVKTIHEEDRLGLDKACTIIARDHAELAEEQAQAGAEEQKAKPTPDGEPKAKGKEGKKGNHRKAKKKGKAGKA
ncbi:hypothetical protein [Streptomyces hydrogenans]|uniref:hypothetical protein n=1 Tax=Streptomyces hydrogenans TaxID=1873719 RepID=UPI00381EB59D